MSKKVKGILVKEKPPKRGSLKWDENNLTQNEEEKVPRMKINEPNTPYRRGSTQEDTDGLPDVDDGETTDDFVPINTQQISEQALRRRSEWEETDSDEDMGVDEEKNKESKTKQQNQTNKRDAKEEEEEEEEEEEGENAVVTTSIVTTITVGGDGRVNGVPGTEEAGQANTAGSLERQRAFLAKRKEHYKLISKAVLKSMRAEDEEEGGSGSGDSGGGRRRGRGKHKNDARDEDEDDRGSDQKKQKKKKKGTRWGV